MLDRKPQNLTELQILGSKRDMFEASGPSAGSISSPHSSLISRQLQLQLQGCPGSKTVLKVPREWSLTHWMSLKITIQLWTHRPQLGSFPSRAFLRTFWVEGEIHHPSGSLSNL